jgi:hypothetical protein
MSGRAESFDVNGDPFAQMRNRLRFSALALLEPKPRHGEAERFRTAAYLARSGYVLQSPHEARSRVDR